VSCIPEVDQDVQLRGGLFCRPIEDATYAGVFFIVVELLYTAVTSVTVYRQSVISQEQL
jgi:hypothetical protein